MVIYKDEEEAEVDLFGEEDIGYFQWKDPRVWEVMIKYVKGEITVETLDDWFQTVRAERRDTGVWRGIMTEAEVQEGLSDEERMERRCLAVEFALKTRKSAIGL